MNNLLSVVTINKNNADGLNRTLSSLRPYRNDERFELVYNQVKKIQSLSHEGLIKMIEEMKEGDCG